jgi:2-keto-4-pentenoate hydratase/2-oxohepta-3-ene-1,7-dioic acid hydratase in catechol pathway
MKLCRLQPLALGQLEPSRSASARFDIPARTAEIVDGAAYEIAGLFPGNRKRTGLSWPLKDVRLLPPVEPGKIVGMGRNYREHALELDHSIPIEPLIFLKPPSSVIGPEEPILLPAISKRVDHEGELAVIVGRTCSQLSDREAVDAYVLGYTCLNDVTARDLQKADVQFTRGKSFDTFCPLGPVIETTLDLGQTRVQSFVNGVQRQSGALTEMIFPVDVIIRWISRVMTLLPGDVIATGTPAGVGPLAPGDIVEVVVSGIGTLRNPVAAREA